MIVFSQVTCVLGVPDIDLLTSRLNYPILPYVAWRPDLEAIAIDALTVNWSDYLLIYAFPPFSVIPLVLQKIQMEEADAIMVVPPWPTQEKVGRHKSFLGGCTNGIFWETHALLKY